MGRSARNVGSIILSRFREALPLLRVNHSGRHRRPRADIIQQVNQSIHLVNAALYEIG